MAGETNLYKLNAGVYENVTQGGAIAAATSTYVAPSGGATQDAEARAALAQLATDVSGLITKLNSLLATQRAQALIAT